MAKAKKRDVYARNKTVVAVLAIVLVVAGVLVLYKEKDKNIYTNMLSTSYNPEVEPSDFTTNITNKYFSLPVGKKMFFTAETEEGLEKIEIEIGSETREIMGIKTVLYRDKVYVGDELVEDTHDWLAQDNAGNVWYFGEEVNNYEGGKLKDHHGSWIAGIDGAKPGIWIKADNKVGDYYKQEYLKGEAEDMRNVVAVNETIKTNLGTLTGCVKMYDWTPLEPDSTEHKYYCPQVGGLAMSKHLETNKITELTKVQNP